VNSFYGFISFKGSATWDISSYQSTDTESVKIIIFFRYESAGWEHRLFD